MTSDSSTFDIDIDVPDGDIRERYGIRAMKYDDKKQEVMAHPSGIYVDDRVPIDPETGWCAIPFDNEDNTYQKIDILTNSAYAGIKTKKELLEYFHMEPDWTLLEDKRFVKKLPHVHNHYEFLMELQPRSMEDLADALALMRPGKIHLFEEYKENKEKTRKYLYKRPSGNKYFFKKSHAMAFAGMLIVRMNYLATTGKNQDATGMVSF